MGRVSRSHDQNSCQGSYVAVSMNWVLFLGVLIIRALFFVGARHGICTEGLLSFVSGLLMTMAQMGFGAMVTSTAGASLSGTSAKGPPSLEA